MEQNSETILSPNNSQIRKGCERKKSGEREDATIFHVNDSLRGRLVEMKKEQGPTG